MLYFSGIDFIYGSKNNHKTSLLKPAFIAQNSGVFPKKTTTILT
ncbi:hypothetical protein SAMN06265346_10226 [Flavobacterium hercynium]|nr:hypothetical protein SAMN06265346_10226 [Flavobacterium hercynium]